MNLAVERFVTVGEAIGDDDPDIKQEMYRSCQEARLAGKDCEKDYHICGTYLHFTSTSVVT